MDVLNILTSTGELKPVSQWPKVWRTTLSWLDVVEMSAEGNTAQLLKKIMRLGMGKEFDSLEKWRYRSSRGPREEMRENQTVNHMPGDDVDCQLRDNWTRIG